MKLRETHKFRFSAVNGYPAKTLETENCVRRIVLYAEKLERKTRHSVSGDVNSMNRTILVEEYAEDEFGQWAKDEVTNEQGYVDDGKSHFQTIQGPPDEEKRRKGKGKGKKKKTQFCGKKGKKGLSKGNDGFHNVFSPLPAR